MSTNGNALNVMKGWLIMHEVHRPAFVSVFRHYQRFRFIPFQSFLRLYSHVQRQLAVNPVHPFVVEPEAFDITQV